MAAAQQASRAVAPPRGAREQGHEGTSKRAKAAKAAKAAKVAKRSRAGAPTRGLAWMEAYGVALLVVATALFLCLVSYDRADVAVTGPAAQTGRTINLVGPVGAQLADLLLAALGAASFLVATSMAAAGAAFLLAWRWRLTAREAVGYIMFILSSATLFHLSLGARRVLDHLPGGAVGELAGEVMRSLFSTVGSYILVAGTLIVSVVLVTHISLGQGLTNAVNLVADAIRAAGRATGEGLLGILGLSGRGVRRAATGVTRTARGVKEAREARNERLESMEQARRHALEGDPEQWSFGEDLDMPNGDSEAVNWGFDGELPPGVGPAEDDAFAEGGDGPTLVMPSPLIAQRREPTPLGEALPPIIIDAMPEAPPPDKLVQGQLHLGDDRSFTLPPIGLLDYEDPDRAPVDEEVLQAVAGRLEEALGNYAIEGKVREIHPGPVVTMFEFKPKSGTRLSKIEGIAAELAMELQATAVRIVAPIPGKDVVGIEVPNAFREVVFLKEVVASNEFGDNKRHLPMCMGKDIFGRPVVSDLAKMPHLLVAGTTGSGKSVAINSMVVSLLYRYGPRDLRMILVDPKQLEFNLYEGIPHLLLPVVTDPMKAASALRWAVNEMERRYGMLAEAGVRNVVDYNKRVAGRPPESDPEGPACERLPFIVIILDEFADLMMVASKDVEQAVCRLAQKARAAGIHLILATQRPSNDVITGIIKANFPGRVGMTVQSSIDSRVILGQNGCEHLLGYGDMLVLAPGRSSPNRVHGPLVTDKEIGRVVAHLRAEGTPDYDLSILAAGSDDGEGGEAEDDVNHDEVWDQAIFLVAQRRVASASMLQRHLRVGYNRASRLIDQMQQEGIVGPPDGSRPREVLVPPPP